LDNTCAISLDLRGHPSLAGILEMKEEERRKKRIKQDRTKVGGIRGKAQKKKRKTTSDGWMNKLSDYLPTLCC